MDKTTIFLYTLKQFKKPKNQKDNVAALLGEVEKFYISPAESHAIKLLLSKNKKRKRVCFLERTDNATYVGESTESSVVLGTVSESDQPTLQETVEYHDAEHLKILDLSEQADDTRTREDYQQVNSLTNFLTRPKLIRQFPWTPGTTFQGAGFATFNPWQDYLGGGATAPIRKKIDNFRLFRCKGLRIQVRVNGSPFHYGRLYLSYCPGPNFTLPFDGMLNPLNPILPPNNYGSLSLEQLGLKTHWSQYPGVFVDPTTNDVVEMTVPFFCPMNYTSIVSFDQIKNLGQFNIWELNPLRHNNGATDEIVVSISAWIVDPVLSVPTVRPSYAGESSEYKMDFKSMLADNDKNKTFSRGKAGSGAPAASSTEGRTRKSKNQKQATKQKQGDEYTAGGAVSGPATAIADFAGKLSHVPIIGPYATATKMVAGKVASIAKIFGYSRPIILNQPCYMVQKVNGGMALTVGEDTSTKLTLDPKQEITVDPRVVGLQNIDEMTLAHMFKRESLLLKFTWSQTDALSTNLANILVHPGACPALIGANPIFFNTALSFASHPFLYWRGSINYRIQIVASQFHRGRIAVVYNPNNDSSPLLPDQVATYQHILDITQCRDMTYTIRYAHPNPWLERQFVPTTVANRGNPSFGALSPLFTNGAMSFYVFNELASPQNTSDVEVNIFVSAGDDFMVAAPGDNGEFDRLSAFAENIRSAYVGESYEADYSVPNENSAVSQYMFSVLNGDEDDTPDVDNENLVFFGEQIVSLRALLKRYSLYNRVNLAINGASTAFAQSIQHPHIPQWPGYSGPVPPFNAVFVNPNWDMGLTDGNGEFNYVRNTLLSYYRLAYAAYRGNVRYKYVLGGQTLQHGNGCTAMVTRNTVPANPSDLFATVNQASPWGLVSSAPSDRAFVMYNDQTVDGSFAGTENNYQFLHNGLEFEHPFYAHQRFMWTYMRPYVPTAANTQSDYQVRSIMRSRHKVTFTTASSSLVSETAGNVAVYTAAGEDFSLHYFTAAPVIGIAVPATAP